VVLASSLSTSRRPGLRLSRSFPLAPSLFGLVVRCSAIRLRVESVARAGSDGFLFSRSV